MLHSLESTRPPSRWLEELSHMWLMAIHQGLSLRISSTREVMLRWMAKEFHSLTTTSLSNSWARLESPALKIWSMKLQQSDHISRKQIDSYGKLKFRIKGIQIERTKRRIHCQEKIIHQSRRLGKQRGFDQWLSQENDLSAH